MNKTKIKTYKNALILEKLVTLTKEDKHTIIINLLQNKTERELSKELGIPRSTIHDWKSQRQDNTQENTHISLRMIKRKLTEYKPQDSEDIQILLDIKNIIEKILNERK